MDVTATATATARFDSLPTPTPPPTHPVTNSTKSLSLTNGSLKRHHPSPHPPPPAVASYKECLKNHAASIGGHALDGCGEYMPSSAYNPSDPCSLKCAACGCHRNFHRRDPQEHHHHHSSPNFLSCFYPPLPPPPPPQLAPRGLSPSTSPSSSPSSASPPSPLSSPSPPPVSHFPPSSYHTSAPHVLIALGNAYPGPSDEHQRSFMNSSALKTTTTTTTTEKESPGGRKRYRTKFSQEQKEKMFQFSEKLGWRMQKGDDRTVQDFCNEVGVSRGVFKVWMHNNKNTFRKKSEIGNTQNDQKSNEGDDGDEDCAAGRSRGGGGFNCDINGDDSHRNEGNCINLQVSVNESA